MQSIRSELRYVAPYAMATIGAATILSLHFFIQPLRPWPDQGWMLQAAVRHARGEGLTSQMSNDSRDLTLPAFDRLVYFPPGYPLLISALLRAGIEIEKAVKIVNAAALVIGVFGWLFLALPQLAHRWLRVLYSVLLVLACGGLVVKGGTTDLIFWAGVPWWILCIARARIEKGRSSIELLSVAAIITAALITVRWAAAVLVPVGIVAVAIPSSREGWKLLRTALAATVIALPPTLTYLVISAVNLRLSSNANVLSFVEPGWRSRYLLTLYPLQSLFAIPVGLEPVLDRAWRSIDPSMHAAWGIALFRVSLPLILIAAILAAVRRDRLIGSLPSVSASVLLVIVLTVGGLVVFLAWMALRYNWDFVDWSFLSEPRYYRPFLPAFLLGWVMLLDRLKPIRPRMRWAGGFLLVVSILYLFQATARWEWSWLRAHDESLELVTKVRSLAANPGLNLVFDIDISDYIIHPESNLIASGYIGEKELPELRVGRPATLWFVRRVNETTAYLLDRDADRRSFEALRQRFPSTLAWRSSSGNYELYVAIED